MDTNHVDKKSILNIFLKFGIKNCFKSSYLVEALLIIVGIFLRIKLYLYNPSFFCDECSLGSNVIYRNYSELFLPLNLSQCAPPFFLVLSKFILNLSHQYGNLYTQDLVLRAFPLFCSIVSLPLFAMFLNKITSNKIFIWVCISMLAFNTCALNYSIIFKQYSCELMFSLLQLLIFLNFDVNKLSKKILSLYSIIFCISIWFSHTAFNILATGLLYFFFKCFSYDFRRQIKSNLSKISIIAIPFIFNLALYYHFYFIKEYTSDLYGFMINSWTYTSPSFFTLNNFLTLFPKKLQVLIQTKFMSNVFLNIFFLFNLAILFCQKKNFKFKTKFLIITPILLSIIASFLKLYPFTYKFILFSLPLYIIIYCQIFTLIKPNKIFKVLAILILVLLTFEKLNTPIESFYFNTFKQPVRNSVEFIIQNKIPANKIIFASNDIKYYIYAAFPQEQPIPYDWYWEGFKKSKIPQILKYCLLGDYYIFTPNSKFEKNYYAGLINYLNNNKHLTILNTYSYDGLIYIIHLKKISNFE